MVSIYMLQYQNSELIYIGSTIDIVSRVKTHKRNGKSTWGRQDLSIFKLTILDEVAPSDRMYWERFYMQLFVYYGFKLKNKSRIITTNRTYTRPKKNPVSKEDFLRQFD